MRNPFRNLALIALIGLSSCSQETTTPSPTAEQAPEVVASNSILCDLTEKIARDTIALKCLISPEQDPHTYTTKPSDRQALETAQLVLYGGYGLEMGLEGLIESVNSPAPKIAVFEQAVSEPMMTAAHAHDEESDAHAHDEESDAHAHDEESDAHAHDEEKLVPDPHVWLDVENAIAIAKIIQDRLSTLNPDQAETYTQNAAELTADLERLNTWITDQIETIPASQRILITTHDAFNYFTQAYNFQDAEALQGLSTEETPTAAQVKTLVTKIKTAKVPAIFAEVSTNDRAIATVAREANVKVATPPLLTGGLGETETYTEMMTVNTCTIVDNLGGQCTPFE
jgi:manganese/iron transport system substrate-binding protein